MTDQVLASTKTNAAPPAYVLAGVIPMLHAPYKPSEIEVMPVAFGAMIEIDGMNRWGLQRSSNPATFAAQVLARWLGNPTRPTTCFVDLKNPISNQPVPGSLARFDAMGYPTGMTLISEMTVLPNTQGRFHLQGRVYAPTLINPNDDWEIEAINIYVYVKP